MSSDRSRIALVNGPIYRFHPPLAAEIGLNESIALLQSEYIISVRPDHIDTNGRGWLAGPAERLRRDYFHWMSRATVQRTYTNLIGLGLMDAGDFNKHGFLHTQWYALRWEGIRLLTSLIVTSESPAAQNEQSAAQNAPIHERNLSNARSQTAQTSIKKYKTPRKIKDDTYEPDMTDAERTAHAMRLFGVGPDDQASPSE